MEELRIMIRGFASSGISVIISSHILSEIQQAANDIGIIYNGSLLYQNKIGADENLEQKIGFSHIAGLPESWWHFLEL